MQEKNQIPRGEIRQFVIDSLQPYELSGDTLSRYLSSVSHLINFMELKHEDFYTSDIGLCFTSTSNLDKGLGFRHYQRDARMVSMLGTPQGRRHLTLISLMYETGARVQEVVDLTPSSIRLSRPYVIRLCGKGNKTRIVPLDDKITELVNKYMQENGLASQMSMNKPLFFNHSGNKLTPQGITHILKTYAAKARILYPDAIPMLVSPHMLRHSRAMHLLQSGVNLVYIRDLLGHVSVQTTEVYAKADTKSKREALEKAHPELGRSASELPSWERDPELKAFLKGLTR